VPSRREPSFGDFEMDRFVIEDMLLTILNPNFRPYSVSIYHAELPLFRKQWLLYDMFCADAVSGMFDNCLFSVHRPQHALDIVEKSTSSIHKQWAKMVCTFGYEIHCTVTKMNHFSLT
jgi:mitochondrial distribution and morphology protein 31